VDIQEGGEEGL